MQNKIKYILVSFLLIVYPAISQADTFKGNIIFSDCGKNCTSSGSHSIKFHKIIDFTLRLNIDNDSYLPTIKVVNPTTEKVGWSFHVVFFDKSNNIIAAYSLSGETDNTNEYGQQNSSSRINLNPDDMKKIYKYETVIYTF